MKKSLLTMLGFAGALLLANCSKDATEVPDYSKPLEQDETRYVSLSIGTPGAAATRAQEFEQASGDENKVENIYLVFYDAANNYVAQASIKEYASTPTAGNVNIIYSNVVPVEIKRGTNLPTQVLAFVNPTDVAANLTNVPLTDVETKTINRIFRDGAGVNEYFAMSNSVYYNAAGEQMFAVPISDAQLFSKESDAWKALGYTSGVYDSSTVPSVTNPSGILEIYVERYAAKVKAGYASGVNAADFVVGKKAAAEASETDFIFMHGEDQVYLKFEPAAWAVNAVEEESYITKSFFDATAGAPDYTKKFDYNTLNSRLNTNTPNWEWNDAANYRSYWAQSPAYYESKYPMVSDDILDSQDTGDEIKGDYSLRYYSYKEITGEATQPKTYNRFAAPASELSTDGKSVLYAMENTVGTAAFSGETKTDNPKSTVASMVLVGMYKVYKVADDTPVNIPSGQSFYLVGSGRNFDLYIGDNIKKYLYSLAEGTLLDGSGNAYEYDNIASYLEVAHPTEDIRKAGNTMLQIDSRYVALKLKDSPAANAQAIINGEKKTISTTNLAEVNKMLLQQAGQARGYKDGRAYFSTPIKHLGYGTRGSVNTGKEPQDEAFDWKAVQAGDFGLVRNHAYSINITGISGLGAGIPDDEVPIVPPVDETDYYFATRINILNWAKVADQNVEF